MDNTNREQRHVGRCDTRKVDQHRQVLASNRKREACVCPLFCLLADSACRCSYDDPHYDDAHAVEVLACLSQLHFPLLCHMRDALVLHLPHLLSNRLSLALIHFHLLSVSCCCSVRKSVVVMEGVMAGSFFRSCELMVSYSTRKKQTCPKALLQPCEVLQPGRSR